MRVLMIMLGTTLFSINMFAQKSQLNMDSIGRFSIPPYNYNLDDSIHQDSIYKINPSAHSSIIVPRGTIERNGFRTSDGTLYTMRIKVPKSSDLDRMPMPYQWDQSLDYFDPKIVFPPIKKR